MISYYDGTINVIRKPQPVVPSNTARTSAQPLPPILRITQLANYMEEGIKMGHHARDEESIKHFGPIKNQKSV